MGISLETPQGNVVITGDLKLDHDDGIPSEKEQRVWGEIGKDKNLFSLPTRRMPRRTASLSPRSE